jgi:hypothetical protein
MKRVLGLVALLALLSLAAMAENPKNEGWNALGILRNAHYVYVTSYDGPQFSMNLLAEDREAITTVQNAIESDGYAVVYRPSQADMILVVQARGSSDLLAAYDGGSLRLNNYLWRAEAKSGLSGSNPMLVQQLERALERVGAKN